MDASGAQATTPAPLHGAGPEGANATEAGPGPRGVAVAAQALVLLAILVLSGLGNSAVVVVIGRHRRLRTVTNAFIASLSLSDLLSAALCVPPPLAALLLSRDAAWTLRRDLCVAGGFLNTCLGVVSTLTVTLVSLDRYYAIVRQPREKIGRRAAAHLLAAVWSAAVLLSFPWYLLWGAGPGEEEEERGFYRCVYAFHAGSPRVGAAYSLALIAACHLLPFGLMCFCHYNICRAVRLSETRVRPVTTYAHLLRFYSETRTATTVLIMIVLVILCRGPYCLMGIAAAVGDRGPHPGADAAAAWMAWANGAINPLIYAARNPHMSALLGRSREEGYRTRGAAAYLSARGGGGVRYAAGGRGNAGSRVSSSSPAHGGEAATWASKNPAVFFCTDARPEPGSKPRTANTSV